MSKFSNTIVQFILSPILAIMGTGPSTIRHVHVLLSWISELNVVFIEDVKPLPSFCLKSLSWSSDVFKSVVDPQGL